MQAKAAADAKAASTKAAADAKAAAAVTEEQKTPPAKAKFEGSGSILASGILASSALAVLNARPTQRLSVPGGVVDAAPRKVGLGTQPITKPKQEAQKRAGMGTQPINPARRGKRTPIEPTPAPTQISSAAPLQPLKPAASSRATVAPKPNAVKPVPTRKPVRSTVSPKPATNPRTQPAAKPKVAKPVKSTKLRSPRPLMPGSYNLDTSYAKPKSTFGTVYFEAKRTGGQSPKPVRKK